ncbi:MAG: reverse transcriptase domain-containing protein [Candidatus Pacearchaeota archaeon]
MKTYKNLYPQIYNLSNLILAWREARKGKTKKPYVIEFEKDTIGNLLALQEELKNQTYSPKPLVTFILRDPKTRKISKADFRDRIVHHAIVRILEPIFDKTFIYDSCANRKRKGNLFAIKRFKKFLKKVSRNGKTNGWFNENQVKGYCFKADIKHYFEEVNHGILLDIIQKKVKDEQTIWLIEQIIKNYDNKEKGMPLGNLTSQFFANVYLNDLDYFVKHKLKAKYYIRYVDDFVLLSSSKVQLKLWMGDIEHFLIDKLTLELHKQKSKITSLSRGIDFVGFRNFYYYRLVRTRNIRNIRNKINDYKKFKIPYVNILDSFQGWQAYAMWADAYRLRENLLKQIILNTPPSP